MSDLILDAAFPNPNAPDWINVLRAAGATGSMVYVFDPFINPDYWSPDYAHQLQAAGFGVLPVYVTFNQPIGHAREVMAQYGWNSGPVMGDIEMGSFPSEATFAAWCQDLRDHGYTPVAYGTASTLDSYRRYADRAFLASYRALHTVQPVPSLDGVSYDGWQYSDQIFVNGVEVDASVTSIPLIGGTQSQEVDLTSDEHNQLSQIYRVLVVDGTPGFPPPQRNASWIGDRLGSASLPNTQAEVDQVMDLVTEGANPVSGGGTYLSTTLAQVLADIDFLKAHSAATDDPSVGQAVARIEAALKQA